MVEVVELEDVESLEAADERSPHDVAMSAAHAKTRIKYFFILDVY